jgi:ubiquinone biosynthesis protein
MYKHIRRTRNLARYHQIVSVLARHGFGSFLESLRVDRYLPLNPMLFRQNAQPTHLSPAEHFRIALEELGPTFIKLGQVMSTRPDLFPPDYILELARLQDNVPPVSWLVVLESLRTEYQCDPDEIFTEIDPQPLGSASLAQVHAAVLPDGSRVVIKVQRPNIQALIDSDLDILADLAELAQRTSWGQLYNPVEIVAQFAFTLQNELDYRREGLNADRFRGSFANDPHLYIPKVYWPQSTQKILVLERLEGIKIDHFDELDAAGYDRHQVATHAARMLVKEVMEDGFFHADPHPGNFIIMPGFEPGEAVIGAMDFGMVGHISRIDRLNLIQAFLQASRQDAKGIVHHMLRIGAVSGRIDEQALERDIDRMLNQYYGQPLEYIQTTRVVEELMQIAFSYQITLPADLWLLFKTLAMMDGLARRLDPQFDLFQVFGPPVQRLVINSRMPWEWGPSLLLDIENLAYALRDLPNIGESMLRNLQRGLLPFSLSVGADKDTLDRLDRISNRISVSVIAAAFILGLALLFPVARESQMALALVIVAFIISFAIGLWIIYSILRSGK